MSAMINLEKQYKFSKETREKMRKNHLKHGMEPTRFYKSWCDMKARCNNKRNKSYKNYGGRGIKVCDRWVNFLNFRDDLYKSYLEHCKEFGEKDTFIDRIDVNKNYEISNIRWVTQKESVNNRRDNIVFQFNGERKTISQWSEIIGINKNTIIARIKYYKWPKNKVLSPKLYERINKRK